jgi:hypothetical protein
MDDPDGGLDERGNLNGSGDFTQTVVMGVKINAMWPEFHVAERCQFHPFLHPEWQS